MRLTVFKVVALGFSLFTIGCATTVHSQRHTDAEVEMAMRRTEDETLARMAASASNDVADAASWLARERATASN
jgi:hypothetical protein